MVTGEKEPSLLSCCKLGITHTKKSFYFQGKSMDFFIWLWHVIISKLLTVVQWSWWKSVSFSIQFYLISLKAKPVLKGVVCMPLPNTRRLVHLLSIKKCLLFVSIPSSHLQEGSRFNKFDRVKAAQSFPEIAINNFYNLSTEAPEAPRQHYS